MAPLHSLRQCRRRASIVAALTDRRDRCRPPHSAVNGRDHRKVAFIAIGVLVGVAEAVVGEREKEESGRGRRDSSEAGRERSAEEIKRAGRKRAGIIRSRNAESMGAGKEARKRGEIDVLDVFIDTPYT